MPGATSRPTRPVNTTSDITRGFSSATIVARTRAGAARACVERLCARVGHRAFKAIRRIVCRAPPAPTLQCCAVSLMRGSSSNWWNGGGEGSVHSSVVAPAPHGLFAGDAACSAERVEHAVEEDQRAEAGDVGADRGDEVPAGEGVRIVDVAARHAGEAEEVLREEDQVDADERHPEVQLAERLVVHVAGHLREPVVPAGEDARTPRRATARSGSARPRSRCRAARGRRRHWRAPRR